MPMNKMICSTLTVLTLSTLMACGGSSGNDIQPVEQLQTSPTQETPTPSATLNLPATTGSDFIGSPVKLASDSFE